MTAESVVQARIALAVGALPGVRIFRNTVGEGWTGKTVRADGLPPGVVMLRGASRVTFGLCVGSSDLVGWRTVVVTPEMVGRTVALFVGLEVKNEAGRAADAQNKFRDAVTRAGGIAGVVRSPEEAKSILNVR